MDREPQGGGTRPQRDQPASESHASGGARLAREALARARQAAAAGQQERDRGAAARRRAETRAANTAAAGGRKSADGDPLPFGAAIDALLADRGWSAQANVAKVTGDWEGTVGADIAAHCRPVSLRDGVLTLEAESTAWATQIRLLSRTMLTRISEVAGAGTVTRLQVRGPAAPSWKRGRLSVPGRGPRDTYG